MPIITDSQYQVEARLFLKKLAYFLLEKMQIVISDLRLGQVITSMRIPDFSGRAVCVLLSIPAPHITVTTVHVISMLWQLFSGRDRLDWSWHPQGLTQCFAHNQKSIHIGWVSKWMNFNLLQNPFIFIVLIHELALSNMISCFLNYFTCVNHTPTILL